MKSLTKSLVVSAALLGLWMVATPNQAEAAGFGRTVVAGPNGVRNVATAAGPRGVIQNKQLVGPNGGVRAVSNAITPYGAARTKVYLPAPVAAPVPAPCTVSAPCTVPSQGYQYNYEYQSPVGYGSGYGTGNVYGR